MILASLVPLTFYSQQLVLTAPSSAYYLIQARGFELLFGACLAILSLIKKDAKIILPTIVYQLSGLVGLIILAGLFLQP
jgi:peptidoglycan/LPS O-acetylase OafA/YrhL